MKKVNKMNLKDTVDRLYDEIWEGDEAYSSYIRASALLNDSLYNQVEQVDASTWNDLSSGDFIFTEETGLERI